MNKRINHNEISDLEEIKDLCEDFITNYVRYYNIHDSNKIDIKIKNKIYNKMIFSLKRLNKILNKDNYYKEM